MTDWGEVSEKFMEIHKQALNKKLHNKSEAQTRFDVIDRIIKEILGWQHGQISVEERDSGEERGFVDYILRAGDTVIIIEAKKVGTSFPSPTKKKRLKLTGPILGVGEINKAIIQAEEYASTKEASIVMVTNGNCWCFYPFDPSINRDTIYATILFPFSEPTDAETFHNVFSCGNVESGSLDKILISPIVEDNKLIKTVIDADARIGRNNIADLLAPALDHAFYSENILNDHEKLKWCFVSTEGRTKFDNQLKIYLGSAKPVTVMPAPKLRRDKSKTDIEKLVSSKAFLANPVTIIIGTVGSGKTTYLKHFELVKGRDLIISHNTHWIYLDFEKMGKTGGPRSFIYNNIRDYLLKEHPYNPTDYKNAIEPAYDEEIRALARGPYANIFGNKDKFEEKVNEIIHSDFMKVEPYVRKVLKFLASKTQCIVVLDNIDLYEDENLETIVLSEAISFSKEVNCNVIVSLRDTTYVKHRNDSILNAFELKKLWLDPPPFKEVLSRRISYSKKILKGKKAQITLPNFMKLKIPDLSIFFDIIQSSLLSQDQGRLLESLSDRNIRNGIKLVRNFLTSGHVHADLAIKNYLNGETHYRFPYHEVFKGAILGQWKHYKEDRAELINIFNSGLGSQKLLLARLFILKYLYLKAGSPQENNVQVNELIEKLSIIGMSGEIICKVLTELRRADLIKDDNATTCISSKNFVHLTLAGAYIINYLSKRMVYVESSMMDTPIYSSETWTNLLYQTKNIETEEDFIIRLKLRKERLNLFLNYLVEMESLALNEYSPKEEIAFIKDISISVNRQTSEIISKLEYRSRLN